MSLGITKHGHKPCIKQRLGIGGGPSSDGEPGLATSLMKLFGKGKPSAGEVGCCAASVARPGQTLKKLAKAQGKPNPGATDAMSSRALVNGYSSRCLHRAFNTTATLGPTYIAQIQIYSRYTMDKARVDMALAFLPPHCLPLWGKAVETCGATSMSHSKASSLS